MKQPRIRISGNLYNIIGIVFNKDGLVESITYQVSEKVNRTVFGEHWKFRKQPKIHIFGNLYNVMGIEFNKDGLIESIVYQVSEKVKRTVFRGNTIINPSLTSERKIQKPTEHPYHSYAIAPDLARLILFEEEGLKSSLY